MSKNKKIRVGISCGDLNGIGTEVIVKALMDSRVYDHCIPIIYASERSIKTHLEALNIDGFHFKTISTPDKAHANNVNVIDLWKEEPTIELGKPSKEVGQFAFRSLKAATEDLASTKVDVLVTAPIDKKTIQSEDFNFPGHTEYLADYANEDHPLMILVHDRLRVALVTGHLALDEVSKALSRDLILEKLKVFSKSLTQDFGCHRPRIAVLGLNPHNGDDGLMGDEESTTISPAIKEAQEEGILAFGPYPADGFFGSPQRKHFDGILAMYHDQGLAPFKALSFDEGVNFTAGLPIVRTSPDHGVAYNIAGKNEASPTSLRNAILLACDISIERKRYRELAENALEISS